MYRTYDVLKDVAEGFSVKGYFQLSETLFSIALELETIHWKRRDKQHQLYSNIVSAFL